MQLSGFHSSIAWIDHILLIHSWVNGPLSCFHIVAIVSHAATNIVSLRAPAFHSFEYILRRRAGSYGNFVSSFRVCIGHLAVISEDMSSQALCPL